MLRNSSRYNLVIYAGRECDAKIINKLTLSATKKNKKRKKEPIQIMI